MHAPQEPFRKDLVLIGGGHAHAGVLRAFAMRPEPGLRLTVIAKELEAPYSGMLPGYVAGVYTRADCHIDLLPLASAAGARLIHGTARGLDPAARRVLIEGRPSLGFDLLSIDVGITPRLNRIEGAAALALAVKPISRFAPRWERLAAAAARADGPRRIAVIGGGAAGFELALAVRAGLARRIAAAGLAADALAVTLIAGDALLARFPARARRFAQAALRRSGVALIEHDPATALTETTLRLASGALLDADAALISAEAEAPPWARETGLALDAQGYFAVAPTLESLSHPGVFAVGDCAGVAGHPRPKAGVFAVRQGPPLTENLRRAARGERLRPFRPQKSFLSILATADGRAIAAKGGLAVEGGWVWRWKDGIDRAFMAKHRPAPLPENEEMRCGGCAAKIGPAPLAAALSRLEAGGPAAPRDDAAILDDGGPVLRLESVDFFRAFWDDPWLLGRIAAQHAIGDIRAMGGAPERAQAIVALPEASARLIEEDLFQILAGARETLTQEGAFLIGGHSSEGAEISLGFAVSGSVPRERLLRKGGLRPGDALILTRPLGAGLLLAGAMRRRVRGPELFAALGAMTASHRPVMEVLAAQGARAATDVTGFGLAGHLLEMLRASAVGARLEAASLPLYAGAAALAQIGLASTLTPQNRALEGDVGAASGAPLPDSLLNLLFDPQTAGGILAALPAENAAAALAALRGAGAPEAARIGEATPLGDGPPLRIA